MLFRKSRQKPNLESTSKYGFFPDLGEKNGGVLSMRMQVILDSLLARSGSAPITLLRHSPFSLAGMTVFKLFQRFSLECCQTKTKAVTVATHNKR